jgi:hypothetical protein
LRKHMVIMTVIQSQMLQQFPVAHSIKLLKRTSHKRSLKSERSKWTSWRDQSSVNHLWSQRSLRKQPSSMWKADRSKCEIMSMQNTKEYEKCVLLLSDYPFIVY